MFEIYKKKVEINGTEYELRPLPGKFLPKVYHLLGKLDFKEHKGEDAAEQGMRVLKAFSQDEVAMIHDVCMETMLRSYPEQNKAQVEDFVSQNLMTLLTAVIEVNLSNRPGGSR